MRLAKEDFTIGAIYRIGVRRRLNRETLARLLIDRAKMHSTKAEQLVAHWLTSEPYRKLT